MKEKQLYKLLVSILVLVISFLLPVNSISAAETTAREIDIMTTPEKVLFDVSNLKPGDWATRTLTIKNGGTQNFNYLFSAKLNSGSKDLYSELLLTITDENGELYKGKLSDFNKLGARSLKSGSKEDLTFTIEFPASLGNEFQNLNCEVEFIIYAEGNIGGVIPIVGSQLPSTSTNTFNFLGGGLVLIVGGLTIYLVSNRKKLSKSRK